jgi:hypothetical protein
MANKLLYFSVPFWLIAVLGCATVDPVTARAAHEKSLKESLAKVEITDGISYEEAIIISDNYYERYTFSGCGAPGKLVDLGDSWERMVAIGVAGVPLEDGIIIKKDSGRITWKYGPTIDNPKEIWAGNTSQ